ncbi:hypothetical protein CROQUDRAFT_101683 [Cronartium quercuum f. sp. fusiforme G11]|uniref:Uncharacterized protein n=1 Tax=Cronartium quercuum f. sp. fusiforme G11 TaxID=708437 RepID=A0A9P6T575_9BASI|nr:hypothetical protein CROQUDRAFT_101683 [Cronartium quercuum f. sp. fusiforme G11]
MLLLNQTSISSERVCPLRQLEMLQFWVTNLLNMRPQRDTFERSLVAIAIEDVGNPDAQPITVYLSTRRVSLSVEQVWTFGWLSPRGLISSELWVISLPVFLGFQATYEEAGERNSPQRTLGWPESGFLARLTDQWTIGLKNFKACKTHLRLTPEEQPTQKVVIL